MKKEDIGTSDHGVSWDLPPFRRITGAALLFLLLLFNGCYTTRYYSHGPGASFSPPEKNEKVVRRFEQSRRSWFILWGLVPLGDNEPMQDVVDVETAHQKDQRVRNLTITREMKFSDGLIQVGEGVLLGILSVVVGPPLAFLAAALPVPWTTEFSGEVVQVEHETSRGDQVDSAPLASAAPPPKTEGLK